MSEKSEDNKPHSLSSESSKVPFSYEDWPWKNNPKAFSYKVHASYEEVAQHKTELIKGIFPSVVAGGLNAGLTHFLLRDTNMNKKSKYFATTFAFCLFFVGSLELMSDRGWRKVVDTFPNGTIATHLKYVQRAEEEGMTENWK